MNMASAIPNKSISNNNQTEKCERNDTYISPSGSRKTVGAASQRPARTHAFFICFALDAAL
jgi:hypothetical protein